MNYYSALLIFKLTSAKDSRFRKKLESIIIFRAKDFEDANAKALKIGMRRAGKESVRNARGEIELQLTFCYLKTLDIIGKKIDEKEVWSRLTSVRKSARASSSKSPTQTI